MSFYRRTPVRCERLQGAKNPSEFEPKGSNSLETLHFVQGDINSFVSEARHPVLFIFGNKSFSDTVTDATCLAVCYYIGTVLMVNPILPG